MLKWDTVIEQKTAELARFLTGKSLSLDFMQPAPRLERQDSRELRAKILETTSVEAKRLGIGKSTFHYLRKAVENPRPFRLYSGTRKKLSFE